MTAVKKPNGPLGFFRLLDQIIRASSKLLRDTRKTLQAMRPLIHTLGLVFVDVCGLISVSYELIHHISK